MPARLVEDDDGVGAGSDGPRVLFQVQRKAAVLQKGGTRPAPLALVRTDRAEDVDRFRSLIVRCPGACSPRCPSAGGLVLLTDARYVLPPHFYDPARREAGADFRQLGGRLFLKEILYFRYNTTFLKSLIASSFWAGRRGRVMSLRNPNSFNTRPTVVSSSETRNSFHSHCARSLNRHRTTPWVAGIGPLSTILANARSWVASSLHVLPGDLPSINPSGPRALNRNT